MARISRLTIERNDDTASYTVEATFPGEMLLRFTVTDEELLTKTDLVTLAFEKSGLTPD